MSANSAFWTTCVNQSLKFSDFFTVIPFSVLSDIYEKTKRVLINISRKECELLPQQAWGFLLHSIPNGSVRNQQISEHAQKQIVFDTRGSPHLRESMSPAVYTETRYPTGGQIPSNKFSIEDARYYL